MRAPNIPLRLKVARIIAAVDYYKKLGIDSDTAQDMAINPVELPSDDRSPRHPNCRSEIVPIDPDTPEVTS